MTNQGAVGSPAIADSGRRAQILDAALHVMAEHGFRGASIKRIAQRAGLKSPALIYWYFRDKQALFEAVLQRILAVSAAGIAELFALQRAAIGAGIAALPPAAQM